MTPSPTQEISYYIIEHPLRGVMVDQEWDSYPRPNGRWMTKWAWSKPRSEGMKFSCIKNARIAISRLEPESVRETVTILYHTSRAGWHYLEDPNKTQGEPQ